MLSPLEYQAARARIQWTRDMLAREAGVDVSAVVASLASSRTDTARCGWRLRRRHF